ncbi:MAG: hypothetical protein U0792_11125 [Gemmataceae bacterium]
MLRALPSEPAFLAIIEAAERYADDPSTRGDAVATRKPVRATVRRIAGKAPPEFLVTAINRLIDLTDDVIEGHEVTMPNSLYVLNHKKAAVKSDAKVEKDLQRRYERDIYGSSRPVTVDPSWKSDTVLSLAKGIYESRDFSAMPILADALQDAGCENADILTHCRDANGVHVRGCWVVDLVLGKE